MVYSGRKYNLAILNDYSPVPRFTPRFYHLHFEMFLCLFVCLHTNSHYKHQQTTWRPRSETKSTNQGRVNPFVKP